MAIRSLEELPIEGKRTFIRVDLNAPLTAKGKVADDARLRAVIPTVQHCIQRGARVVLASHLGRPKGKKVPSLSMVPVAARLAELLDCDIVVPDEPVGDGARKVVTDLRAGHVALLENLRWDPGETDNDEAFARTLASYADVYVNDAFGTAHRAHASTVGMVEHVAAHGAGFVMQREIDFLSRLLGEVDRPYVAVIGGAKVSGKIDVLDALLGRVNSILIGGAMANTFLKAKGVDVGASKIEEDRLAVARNFLRKASHAKVAVHLPQDVIVAHSFPADDAVTGRPARVSDIGPDMMALDIGPATAETYAAEISLSRTLFWNGPMGVFERAAFAKGTLAVANAIADNRRCLSVVGGGDSAAAIAKAGIGDRISHVSTGGGASLEFIQGTKLPGIAALDDQ